jgi:hypothetical protein
MMGDRSECAPQDSRVHLNGRIRQDQFFKPDLQDGSRFTGNLRKILRKSCLQILFLQDLCVVGDVAGDDVGDRSDRDRVVARDSGPRPGLVGQVLEE